jgi:hypothetical protein
MAAPTTPATPARLHISRLQRVGAGAISLRGEGIRLVIPFANGAVQVAAPRAEWRAASDSGAGLRADGPIAWHGWLDQIVVVGLADSMQFYPSNETVELHNPLWWLRGQRTQAKQMILPVGPEQQQAVRDAVRYPTGTGVRSENASLLLSAALEAAQPMRRKHPAQEP